MQAYTHSVDKVIHATYHLLPITLYQLYVSHAIDLSLNDEDVLCTYISWETTVLADLQLTKEIDHVFD